MTSQSPANTAAPPIDLKDPTLAALLAWLLPGAGHFYQGRTAKGVIYSVCILSTFFAGLWMGGGRCVYFEFEPPSARRWSYFGQVWVGLPALPALAGAYRANQQVWELPLLGTYYMPPKANEYDKWNNEWHRMFELGTTFTLIAGLLNLLAIYDAWQGPYLSPVDPSQKRDPAPA